jgi:hypothetical protein
MHAKGSMDRRAIDAQENTIGHTGPCRILMATIETRLKH